MEAGMFKKCQSVRWFLALMFMTAVGRSHGYVHIETIHIGMRCGASVEVYIVWHFFIRYRWESGLSISNMIWVVGSVVCTYLRQNEG